MNYQAIIRERPNTEARQFVVGDIHGAYRRLKKCLDDLKFDPTKDTLYSVGDLCDRGPNSWDILEWMDYPWFKPVYGNHEDMFCNWLDEPNWTNSDMFLGNGGRWVEEQRKQKYELDVIYDYFKSLPYVYELEYPDKKIGIIHAEIPTIITDWNLFLEQIDSKEKGMYTRSTCIWGRSMVMKAAKSYIKAEEYQFQIDNIDHIYVGHNTTHKPIKSNKMTWIDTGACYPEGFFSIVEIQTGQIHTFDRIKADI